MFVLIKSWKSSKLGHIGSKTRPLGQILEKHCVPSRDHILSPIIMKLFENVCLNEIADEVGSITRSLSQVLEKPCVCAKGHIFSQIMKLGQNVCLDQISDWFENWSCRVKN